MKKLLLLPLMFLLILSCKKDEDEKCSTTLTSVSGTYKFTAYTYKSTATAPEQDYYAVLFPDACSRDDMLTLNANGQYTLKDAGAVCSPPGDDNGSWSLSNSTINIDGEIGTVESFDCKTLVIGFTGFMAAGDKLKITLIKQ